MWEGKRRQRWQRDLVTVSTRVLSQLPNVTIAFLCSSRGGLPPMEGWFTLEITLSFGVEMTIA